MNPLLLPSTYTDCKLNAKPAEKLTLVVDVCLQGLVSDIFIQEDNNKERYSYTGYGEEEKKENM